MGAISPIVTTGALLGLNLLDNANSAQRAQRAADQSSATARASADAQLARLQLQQESDAAERQSALRRAQARTRALLASRGVGGSGGAVLQGLAVESAREQSYADRDADLQRQQIELGADTTQQRNLLAVSDARRRAQLDSLRTGVRSLNSSSF
jgi:hypothetical protein